MLVFPQDALEFSISTAIMEEIIVLQALQQILSKMHFHSGIKLGHNLIIRIWEIKFKIQTQTQSQAQIQIKIIVKATH